jgi:hypothetical protein
MHRFDVTMSSAVLLVYCSEHDDHAVRKGNFNCLPLFHVLAGITPDRIVPLKYVVRMADPKGVVALSRSNTGSLSNTSLANMFGAHS